MKIGWILIFLLFMAPAASSAGQPNEVGLAAGTTAAVATSGVNEVEATNCLALASVIRKNQTAITHDLGQIKRDLLKLQQRFDEPGLSQIFAGIGYILGLCGVAALVASRKK